MARMNTDAIRTSRVQFDLLFGKLVQFMRAKTNKQIDDQFYDRISFYPYEAVEWAINDHIDRHRPTAGNFPTPSDLANACAVWLNARPLVKHSMMTYSKYDDTDFPLEFLNKAFEILCDIGQEECRRYCDQMRMPLQDRERVAMKYKAVMARKDINVEIDKMLASICA